MPNNQQLIVYTFGFIYFSVLFCWKQKELYRMPYEKDNRYYNKRKLKQQKVGNSLGYWICGDFKSMRNLKGITKKIHFEETVNIESNLPF